jgi:4-diphosphocytidyl-2-C-methyl-D-erythritol kinase
MISVPAFAKINLGLRIGRRRADGFHELRTIYQTLALNDIVCVGLEPGSGIEIRCDDSRVPLNESNTCHKIIEQVVGSLDSSGIDPLPAGKKIVIEIEKHLPVQGGLGAASANAVAAMLGLERVLNVALSPPEKMRIAAEVGSDVPLFLIGGTVLGVGRGEEVYPLPDVPRLDVVVITPAVGVSTPAAFARWDELNTLEAELTRAGGAGTIQEFSSSVFGWLNHSFPQASPTSELAEEAEFASGVPAVGGDRAETPLLDLVRAGIENDFERVVFPEYPDLREVKKLLLREGALYASLSGSGSTLYGLFASEFEARAAAERMTAAGHKAIATTTLMRAEYWKAITSN